MVLGWNATGIEYNDSLDNYLPKIKAFYGRWIFDMKTPEKLINEDGDEITYFAVAESAKGNIVVYTYSSDRDSVWGYKLLVFPSFEKAAACEEVNYAIRQAVKRRGVQVEELDI